MSLKAESLKINPNKKKAIMKEVTAILAQIDDEIKHAYDQDKTSISATVPVTFNIPYMSNTTAQRNVYYHILSSLLDRGFIVKIHLSPDSTTFFIKWLSEDEEKEVDLCNTLIAKHAIKK